jgi:hypothetical protein
MGTNASGFSVLTETSPTANYSTPWYSKIRGLPSSTTFRGQPYDWNGENYDLIYKNAKNLILLLYHSPYREHLKLPWNLLLLMSQLGMWYGCIALGFLEKSLITTPFFLITWMDFNFSLWCYSVFKFFTTICGDDK